MRDLVFVFPGQSSRDPEMFDTFVDDPESALLLAQASDILGFDVARHFTATDPFASNRNIQIGVFLANHLALMRLRRFGLQAVTSLGLSLGEYNHLVEIGALGFAEALRLVDARGRVYDAGPAGKMVSLFPTSRAAVEEILAELALSGVVEISNDNSPTQLVIAGDAAAVDQAAAEIAEREFLDPVTIEDRIPMHASVFQPAAVALRPHLEAAPWQRSRAPYRPNVTATALAAPRPAEIIDLLTAHVHRPVLWRQSIEAVLAAHPQAVFVEVGPRRVLCNLLSKRWVKNPRFASSAVAPEEIAAALETVPT